MTPTPESYRALTQSVSRELAGLCSSTPDVMKAFNDLGGGPSLMYAASAVAAFDEFAGVQPATANSQQLLINEKLSI